MFQPGRIGASIIEAHYSHILELTLEIWSLRCKGVEQDLQMLILSLFPTHTGYITHGL